MYKAIKEIGGYGIGEEVPTEKALVWLEMYSVPQVEKVEEAPPEEEEKVEEVEEKESSLGSILEDYLGRNQNVVKKNILSDRLREDQLKELLKLEENDKKRPLVINAIKQRLEE